MFCTKSTGVRFFLRGSELSDFFWQFRNHFSSKLDGDHTLLSQEELELQTFQGLRGSRSVETVTLSRKSATMINIKRGGQSFSGPLAFVF